MIIAHYVPSVGVKFLLLKMGWIAPNCVELPRNTPLRRLLSIEDIQPILHQVIDSGVVPRLVEILNRVDKPRLQFQAAWALG
jgi:importin subunit alpha-6/7